MVAENGLSAKDAYLQELRSQVERLQALIAAIESGGGMLPNGDAPSRRVEAEVRPDSFYGMTTPQAMRKYLEMMGKGNPQTPTAIAEALARGGVETPVPKLLKNIYTAFRPGRNTEFVKIGKLWGLHDWYPNRKDEKTPAKGKHGRRRPGQAHATTPKAPSGGFGAFNQFVKERAAAGKGRQEAIQEWQQRKAESS